MQSRVIKQRVFHFHLTSLSMRKNIYILSHKTSEWLVFLFVCVCVCACVRACVRVCVCVYSPVQVPGTHTQWSLLPLLPHLTWPRCHGLSAQVCDCGKGKKTHTHEFRRKSNTVRGCGLPFKTYMKTGRGEKEREWQRGHTYFPIESICCFWCW